MELKSGYKKTEVGIIPDSWAVYSIAKVTKDIFLGLTSKVAYVNSGGYPLVRATDINNEKLSFENVRFISVEQHKSLTKYRRAKKGDVLVSKSGSLGVCAKVNVDTEFSIYESIIVLQSGPKLDSDFLLWLLRYEGTQERMIGEKVGSSVAHLNIEMFRKLVIPVPNPQEQTAIATALSDADALITSLEKLIAKKRNIKQGAMQQLLKPKKGWEVKRLGDFLIYEQPTEYLVRDTEYHDNNQTPVLTAGKTFILGYTNEAFGIFKKLPVIIFDDFTTAIKYVDFPFKAKSSAMKMLKPSSSKVNLRFIYELMSNIKFPLGDHKRHWIGEYQDIEILLPKDENEQNQIASILSDMNHEIDLLQSKLEKYRQIKSGMMQNLLTGKIRLV